MLFVDSHVHFGSFFTKTLNPIDLIESMKMYKIVFGVVSNLEGCEFDQEQNIIRPEFQVPQEMVCKRTLEVISANSTKLKGIFWAKPHTETCDTVFRELLLENREQIKGIKIHPYHSNVSLMDEKCRSYLEFADEHKLIVAVHTAADIFSKPSFVDEAAGLYKNITFIMVHMGLGTDNLDAMEVVNKYDNVYGDTCRVSPGSVVKAIQNCGSEKVLFGTDSIVDGINTYKAYHEIMYKLDRYLSTEEQENLYYKNTCRIFDIKL